MVTVNFAKRGDFCELQDRVSIPVRFKHLPEGTEEYSGRLESPIIFLSNSKVTIGIRAYIPPLLHTLDGITFI